MVGGIYCPLSNNCLDNDIQLKWLTIRGKIMWERWLTFIWTIRKSRNNKIFLHEKSKYLNNWNGEIPNFMVLAKIEGA